MGRGSQLLERVKTLPGVQSASMADHPLLGGAWITGIAAGGYQPQPGQDMNTTQIRYPLVHLCHSAASFEL